MPTVKVTANLGAGKYTVEVTRNTGNIPHYLAAVNKQLADLEIKKAAYLLQKTEDETKKNAVKNEFDTFTGAPGFDQQAALEIATRLNAAIQKLRGTEEKLNQLKIIKTAKTKYKAQLTAKLAPDVRGVYEASFKASVGNGIWQAIHIPSNTQDQLFIRYKDPNGAVRDDWSNKRAPALDASIAALNTKVAQIDALIAASDAAIAKLIAELVALKAQLVVAQAVVEAAIADYASEPESAHPSHAAVDTAMHKMRSLIDLIQKNNLAQAREKLKKKGFEKHKAYLNDRIAKINYRLHSPTTFDSEINTGAYPEQFEPVINSKGSAVVFNMCLYAAKQKHKPTYRTGTFTHSTFTIRTKPPGESWPYPDDYKVITPLANITLDECVSKVQGFKTGNHFNLNKKTHLTDVPIVLSAWYPPPGLNPTPWVDTDALMIGDTVIVGFYENWDTPHVIGIAHKIARNPSPAGIDSGYHFIQAESGLQPVGYQAGDAIQNYYNKLKVKDSTAASYGYGAPYYLIDFATTFPPLSGENAYRYGVKFTNAPPPGAVIGQHGERLISGGGLPIIIKRWKKDMSYAGSPDVLVDETPVTLSIPPFNGVPAYEYKHGGIQYSNGV